MFITELPVDEDGNRRYTNSQAQVIEVKKETIHREGFEDYEQYRVLAPQSFVEKWPTLSTNIVQSIWIEVSGPARLLVEDDYVILLQEANVKNAYVDQAVNRLR